MHYSQLAVRLGFLTECGRKNNIYTTCCKRCNAYICVEYSNIGTISIQKSILLASTNLHVLKNMTIPTRPECNTHWDK